MPETIVKHPCERCGHSPDWHALDDSLNVAPTDPAAKFRCYGHEPGAHPARSCDCPDFVGEAVTIQGSDHG